MPAASAIQRCNRVVAVPAQAGRRADTTRQPVPSFAAVMAVQPEPSRCKMSALEEQHSPAGSGLRLPNCTCHSLCGCKSTSVQCERLQLVPVEVDGLPVAIRHPVVVQMRVCRPPAEGAGGPRYLVAQAVQIGRQGMPPNVCARHGSSNA